MDKSAIVSLLQPTLKTFFKIGKSSDKYDEFKDVFSSKIGGIPYWPKGKDYPTLNGKTAKLIFQLNIEEAIKDGIQFDKVIPDFPKKGIIQFFFAFDDDMWGYPETEESTLVIYHEDTSIEHYLSEELIYINTTHEDMPFDKSVKVSFKQHKELLGTQDLYNHAVLKSSNQGFDLDNEDLYYEVEEANNAGSKVGGYAYFTQTDPLYYVGKKDVPNDLVLLLQLDSEDELHMMWGDCGVANWRVSLSKLKERDFSKVYFNWDCC